MAATEPMPAICPVKGMYSGGAVTWAGGSSDSGFLAKDGSGARLGLGEITDFGAILDIAWVRLREVT